MVRIVRGSERPLVAASHEDPAQPGSLKRVLAVRDELLDGRVQMINWARIPAGKAFRAHYHEDMEEIFIIVSGAAEISADGGESSRLDPGDAVFIPPRAVHTMRSAGDGDCEYLVVGISAGRGGRTVLA